jgi:hypothetical protein
VHQRPLSRTKKLANEADGFCIAVVAVLWSARLNGFETPGMAIY